MMSIALVKRSSQFMAAALLPILLLSACGGFQTDRDLRNEAKRRQAAELQRQYEPGTHRSTDKDTSKVSGKALAAAPTTARRSVQLPLHAKPAVQQTQVVSSHAAVFDSSAIGRAVNTMLHDRAKTHPGWADKMDAFYSAYGYQPVWYRGGWSDEALVAASTLNNAWGDGLPPHRYLSNGRLDLQDARSLADIAHTELALTQVT